MQKLLSRIFKKAHLVENSLTNFLDMGGPCFGEIYMVVSTNAQRPAASRRYMVVSTNAQRPAESPMEVFDPWVAEYYLI